MRQRSTDLLAAIAITPVAMVAMLVPATPAPVKVILGIVVVLVLPGYAVTAACIPDRSLRVRVPEYVCLTLGVSLSITVVGGLLLEAIRRLDGITWSILLGGITLVASAVALKRRSVVDARHPQPGQFSSALPDIGRMLRRGLWLGLVVLMVAGAFAISINGAVNQQRSQQSTQLWMLPSGTRGPEQRVQVGLTNMQPTTTSYNLEVLASGKPVKQWPSIKLEPDEAWQTTLALPQSGAAPGTTVEAVLYLQQAPSTPYRTVDLRLGP
jgi:uncharacterized membrane protein